MLSAAWLATRVERLKGAWRRILLCGAATTGLGLPPSVARGPARDADTTAPLAALIRALDSLVTDRANTGRFSGVILIGRIGPQAPPGGTPLFLQAYGLADRDARVPNDPNTRFITASTAKAFTAVAVAQLLHQHVLAANAPVSEYLPDSVFPLERGRHITVQSLLTHTAGLPDVVTSRLFRSDPTRFARLDDVIPLVRDTPPVGDVGTFHYGDGDYVLLGAIIERTTRQSFAAFLRDHVFLPAGMMGSGFDIWPRPPDLAHGYTTRRIENPTDHRSTPPSPSDSTPALHRNDGILPHVGIPGAVAYTTAPDLMRFADALLRHTLLDAASVNELWTGRVDTQQSGPNRQYAYGFFVGPDSTVRLVNHGGTGPGIDNAFDIYPDRGYVVVILANLDPPAAQDLRAVARNAFARLDP